MAYDAELERYRILEDEMSPVEPEDYYGVYFYFKEVAISMSAHTTMKVYHACRLQGQSFMSSSI